MFIATENAIVKLSRYELTEVEVVKEFKDRIKANKEGLFLDMSLNMKNEDLIILPSGQKTALIFENGVPINGSYEDLPQVKFKDNKWIKA